MPEVVRDEVLLAGLLAPMAFANLRAPLRKVISVSDASENGGSAGEAVAFSSALSKKVAAETTALELTALEEIGESRRQSRCTKCGKDADLELLVCPLGCPVSFCSVQCYCGHRPTCSHAVLERQKVVISSPEDERVLAWELLRNGVPVETEKPGRKRFSEAGLLVVVAHLPTNLDRDAGKYRAVHNAALRQLDASTVGIRTIGVDL